MRSRTAEWFETKIKYEKMTDDGTMKKVSEQYVVDALSFTEAEKRVTEEMSSYISGEYEVANIKKAAYGEIFFTDVDTDDKWYKSKLQFITLDEKSGKEKRQNVNYLVQGKSILDAVKSIDQVMGTTMIDYEIASVTETMIMDVFEYNSVTKKTEQNDKPEFQAESK